MSENYLNRGDAPFSEKVWAKIDEAAVGAAKSQLSARRVLHIEGPYGLGFKLLPGADQAVDWPDATAARGRHWYLLKVIQKDDETAWTSPVWIDRD